VREYDERNIRKKGTEVKGKEAVKPDFQEEALEDNNTKSKQRRHQMKITPSKLSLSYSNQPSK